MSMLARLSTTGGVAPTYVEDVFSTWLYTGNGSTQTITNGVDLAGKGGLVWIKARSGATDNVLVDTVRGASANISSNLTTQSRGALTVTAFGSTGFTVTNDTLDLVFQNTTGVNGTTYTSWTFREQPKFFDVVTYTGDGNPGRTVAHNLGSVPGCIFVKRRDSTSNWAVYHRSLGATQALQLNTTTDAAAIPSPSSYWNNTTPTATVFTVGDNLAVNTNGGTYVAYLFAHDAGGFGASGTDNVISCGSYTGNGGTITVNLGYEPQWVMIKNASATASWNMLDIMRGWDVASASDQRLAADSAGAESILNAGNPTATGFEITSAGSGVNASGNTYIYIAIRRGPMRTPTTGTSVFSPLTYTGATGTVRTTNFPVDMQISALRGGSAKVVLDRLRGVSTNSTASGAFMITNGTQAESASSAYGLSWNNTGFSDASFVDVVSAATWNFRRSPGFFDVVCYAGTGSARTVNHNLGAVPELMIVKSRTASVPFAWSVYVAPLGNSADLSLNNANSPTINDTNVWNATNPTSNVFSVGISGRTNSASDNFVAYLFASVPGVSKVGGYTGNGGTVNTNGTAQTINCGFTAGARFVLIKRTDSTGDWYVFDSARGIVASNDPYLLMNGSAAEVTTVDAVDPVSSGFIVNQTSGENLNVTSATYIYLAIA